MTNAFQGRRNPIFISVAIRGVSMAPTLADGDIVLAVPNRWRLLRTRPGEVVIVDHPQLGLLVKRISERLADGRFTLEGDNALSTCSADLGAVPESAVLGRAVLRVPRKGLVKWIWRRPRIAAALVRHPG